MVQEKKGFLHRRRRRRNGRSKECIEIIGSTHTQKYGGNPSAAEETTRSAAAGQSKKPGPKRKRTEEAPSGTRKQARSESPAPPPPQAASKSTAPSKSTDKHGTVKTDWSAADNQRTLQEAVNDWDNHHTGHWKKDISYEKFGACTASQR